MIETKDGLQLAINVMTEAISELTEYDKSLLKAKRMLEESVCPRCGNRKPFYDNCGWCHRRQELINGKPSI